MSTFYEFTGRIDDNQNLVWVTQTTITSDGQVTVSQFDPDDNDFEVDPDGTGKVEIEWDDIVEFSSAPAILLTAVQTSSGTGKRTTATVKSLGTDQAEIQTVDSSGDNKNRAFSFTISGYA